MPSPRDTIIKTLVRPTIAASALKRCRPIGRAAAIPSAGGAWRRTDPSRRGAGSPPWRGQ